MTKGLERIVAQSVAADVAFFLLIVAIGGVLRFLGQASLRLIEKEPDLLDRDDLIWGATWLWLLIPAIGVTGWLLAEQAHRLGYYELTTRLIVRLLFPVVVALIFWYRPRADLGLILWWATIRDRQNSEFRLAEWLRERERQRRRRRWVQVGISAIAACLALATIWLVWRYTLPLDRMLMQIRENAALEQLLQREMTGTLVDRVHVYAPNALAPDRVGAKQGDKKLVLGRYTVDAEHILLVVPKEDADATRAEAVIEATRAALRRAERHERWGIVIVQPTGGPSPAQAYYEP